MQIFRTNQCCRTYDKISIKAADLESRLISEQSPQHWALTAVISAQFYEL